MMPYTIPLLAVCLVVAGCASPPPAQPRAASYAVYITGYDVPAPAENPYADEVGRREYLRFYHQAYLTTMWDHHMGYSTISPISDHVEAAIAGHYDGQQDAHAAKRAYWASHGREYGIFDVR